MFSLTRIIGGLIKLMGNTDGTPIGNELDALKVNIRDSAGNAFGTPAHPLTVNVASAIVGTPVTVEGQVLSAPSGSLTTIVTYTVPPASSMFLEQATASGTNIAEYSLTVNSTRLQTKRTTFSNLNAEFSLALGLSNGYPLTSGDVVTLAVLFNRPDPGDFEAQIQMTLIS